MQAPYKGALSRDAAVRKATFEQDEQARLAAFTAAQAGAVSLLQHGNPGAGSPGIASVPRSARTLSGTSEDDVRAALLPRSRQDQSKGESGISASTTETQDDPTVTDDAAAVKRLNAILDQIVQHTRSAIRAGEDKLALTVTAYGWVDRHIRRLDSDLMQHEESLSLGLRAGTLPSTDAQQAQVQAMVNAAQVTQSGHVASGVPGETPAGGKGQSTRNMGGKDMATYPTQQHREASAPKVGKKRGSRTPAESPGPGRWIIIPPEATSDANEVCCRHCRL